jgi:hypothetical protein
MNAKRFTITINEAIIDDVFVNGTIIVDIPTSGKIRVRPIGITLGTATANSDVNILPYEDSGLNTLLKGYFERMFALVTCPDEKETDRLATLS